MKQTSIFFASLVASLLAIGAQAEVPFLTGGIGSEEREQIQSLKDNYNLQVKAAYTTGHYLADVELVISNADGIELLTATTEGPFFYAKLPAGNYAVTARFEGQEQKATFSISENAPMREVMLRFKPMFNPSE